MCDDGWSVVYGGRNAYATGDTRHGRRGTARGNITTRKDKWEQKHVGYDKCDELVWCIQVVTRDTGSTGCVAGQARELATWGMYEWYGRRGMMCQR